MFFDLSIDAENLLWEPEFRRGAELHYFAFLVFQVHSERHHGVPSGSLFNPF